MWWHGRGGVGQCYPVFVCNWFEVSSTYSRVSSAYCGTTQWCTAVPMHHSIFICPMVLTCNCRYGVVYGCGVGGCGCGMPPDHPRYHPCYTLHLGKDRGKPLGVHDPTHTRTPEGYIPLGGYPGVGQEECYSKVHPHEVVAHRLPLHSLRAAVSLTSVLWEILVLRSGTCISQCQ